MSVLTIITIIVILLVFILIGFLIGASPSSRVENTGGDFKDGSPILRAVYKNGVMTVYYEDATSEQYYGNCTVWHKMPLMQRCTTPEESKLSDIWTYINHFGNPYPNAHEEYEDFKNEKQ